MRFHRIWLRIARDQVAIPADCHRDGIYEPDDSVESEIW